MYTVWTITYNKDGSVNNEELQGEFQNKHEAIELAKRINGEVREHETLDSMYDEGYSVVPLATVKDIRLMTGLSAQKFGDQYGIPLRTIQNWETGQRNAPEYVINLLERVVKMDYDAKNRPE